MRLETMLLVSKYLGVVNIIVQNRTSNIYLREIKIYLELFRKHLYCGPIK